MANILGRNDRRRRVLNEEALSASTAHLALRRGEDEPSSNSHGQRYSEQAGVEHHPQVTDFLPRRFSMLSVLAGAGIATTALVEALYWYADPVTTESAGVAFGPLAMRVVGGIEAWLSAMLLLAAAATCLMIYSLRRHRIDDYRGRYRVWLGGAVACLVASVDSVAPVHSLFASATAHYSGWTAMRAHSVWWLAVAGLPLGWITVRAWLDARESRLAATALAMAVVSYAVALGVFLTGWPAGDVRTERVVSSAATLVGNWMLLLGVVAYGRYVVLDAQGLISAKASRPQRAARKSKRSEEKSAEPSQQPVTARAEQVATVKTASSNTLRAFRQGMRDNASREEAESASSRWVDGSEPLDEDYGDEEFDASGGKLSKSDRKRLRKLKAQNRAA